MNASRSFRLTAVIALIGVAVLSVARPVHAQSLRGSMSSVELMYESAVSKGLEFYETAGDVREAAEEGTFVRVKSSDDLTVKGASFPYVLPATRDWVTAFAEDYRDACKQPLVVTSGVRPAAKQPRNASPLSVHPTGMAIDLRRPKGKCLAWLRRQLVAQERAGTVEATEERRPAHFHVAVLPSETQTPLLMMQRHVPEEIASRPNTRPASPARPARRATAAPRRNAMRRTVVRSTKRATSAAKRTRSPRG
jgi:hypothetical protein